MWRGRIFRGRAERFLLRADLLAADGHHVLAPDRAPPIRAASASCGVAETTRMSARPLSFSRLSRTNGNGGTPRTISSIASLTAFDQASVCFSSGSPVVRDRLLQGRIAQLRLPLDPVAQRLRNLDLHAAGPHLRPLAAVHSSASTSAGKRLIPRLFEYRLTNSAASRAYLLTPCRSQ